MSTEYLRFKSVLDDTDFANALRRMSTGVSGMALAFGTALGAVALAGDKAALSLGKISAATGSISSARDVYASLRDVASETGLSIADSASQFSRFSIAARQIGASNDEVVKLIDTIAKAGIVSGTTAQEAAAAGTQIGQALASGRFQGDELKSVMENMPILAEALAKQLGVGIGELREMGKEGSLTADIVFPALLNSATEIEAKFREMPVSLERGWQGVNNEVQSYLAQLDQAIGLSSSLVSVMEGLQGKMSSGKGWMGKAQNWALDLISPFSSDPEADPQMEAQVAADEAAKSQEKLKESMRLKKEEAELEQERLATNKEWKRISDAGYEARQRETAQLERQNKLLEERNKAEMDRQSEEDRTEYYREIGEEKAAQLTEEASGLRSLTRINPAEERRKERAALRALRGTGDDMIDPKTGEKISDSDVDRENERKRRENDFRRAKGEKEEPVIERDADPRQQAQERVNKRAEQMKMELSDSSTTKLAKALIDAAADLINK